MRRRRRFGRRRGFGRGGPRARQFRAKVTLLSDNYDFLGFTGTGQTTVAAPMNAFNFPTGVGGAWSIDQAAVAGISNEGLPVPRQGTTESMVIPRFETSGMCAIFPLWNSEFQEFYGSGGDVSMKALWGYLFPSAVVITSSGVLARTGDIVKVRFALASIAYSHASTRFRGNINVGGGFIAGNERPMPPINIWCFDDLNRTRIWWMRDWYMPVNPNDSATGRVGLWEYWLKSSLPGAASQATQAKDNGGNEVHFASPLGPPRVNLRRRRGALMRITSIQWPTLIVGISGAFAQDAGLTVAGAGNTRTLASTTTISFGMNGDLRAFITR